MSVEQRPLPEDNKGVVVPIQSFDDYLSAHRRIQRLYELPEFRITRAQMSPLKETLITFLRNLHHGFGISKEIATHSDFKHWEEYEQLMDQAFGAARLFSAIDSVVRTGIVFNEDLSAGTIFLSHPIISGKTPNLDMKQAMERRLEQNPQRGRGGFERINTGYIHQDFLNAHLNHTPVQAEDYLRRRKLWVNFWKTT